MRPFFSGEILARAAFFAYRFRFLAIYVVVGLFSLCCEIVVFRGLERVGLAFPYCAVVGVVCGVFFAYWGNIRFNFKVPIKKRRRALAYFAGISFLSWSIQFLLRRKIATWGLNYEEARFLVSGCAFLAAYLLHRRFSFSDYKKVGVAVYASGIEDIKGIHQRIGDCADIIHVDLVDSSFGREDHDVRTYRLEVVRAYWPRTPIHAHVMSRRPSRYLREICVHVDRVYVHVESDDDVDEMVSAIRAAGKEPGIALSLGTPTSALEGHLRHVASVLVLAIAEPGFSGQSFQLSALERISALGRLKERGQLEICVDGGVTEKNVGLLNVEIVISGSSVLTHSDPRRQIMRLQTSSSYEQV